MKNISLKQKKTGSYGYK